MVAELVGVVVALAVVLGLAYAAIRVMKALHLRAGGGPAITRFVRALPLGPRERLVVVVHRDEELLLGVTGGQITLLDRRPAEPAPPAAPEEETRDSPS